MGRYYSGDIEGKFMFAVHSSDSADRVGSTGTNNYLEYYFDSEHLETIEEELKDLKESYEKVNKFFEDLKKKGESGYSNDAIKDAGISSKEMEDYADYLLGEKIKKCVIENGDCQFQAEL
jgi:hypothetical protein